MTQTIAKTCSATTKAGAQCRSRSVGADGLCAYHSGRVQLNTEKARERGLEVRRKKAERRAKTLDDLLADELEAHASTVVDAFLAGLSSDNPDTRMRAAELWLSRVKGKPKERTEVDQRTKLEADVWAMDMQDMEARLHEVLRMSQATPSNTRVVDEG